MAHILLLRFSAMGDVAMLVPVVRAFAAQHGEAELTVVSRPFARVFFEGLSPRVHFIGINPQRDYKGLGGLNRLYRELRGKGFTHVADCHDVLRTKYLRLRLRLSGLPTAHIDKHRALRRALTRSSKTKRQLPTSFDNYAQVLRSLGFAIQLPAEPVARTKAPARLIGIAPFAAHRGKIYPEAKLREVVKGLLDASPDVRLYFFGAGDEEHAAIRRLMGGDPRCEDASATLHGLGEELQLMRRLDVMLTMDSANMHLASLVGTRVVSIWGATHPCAGFLGWGQHADDALGRDLPCRPCSIYGNRPCRYGDYRCLDLPPTEVVARLLSV